MSCTNGETQEEEPVESYILPDAHSDDSNELKKHFFEEPFRDIGGGSRQLGSMEGTPMLIVMFPSFLTEDGRRSLLGLESLQAEFGTSLVTVIIPVEDADTIEPALKDVPEGMMFLFRVAGEGNLSLSDKYAEFFWDTDLIAADFPHDPEGRHRTGPFYWVVDSGMTIREKLIDYSDTSGVGTDEVREVLEALMNIEGDRTETDDTDPTE